MLRITVEVGKRTVAVAEIGRVRVSEGLADYSVRVLEEFGEERHTTLLGYPRWSASLWDLVARGVAKALTGRERLPPRPRRLRVAVHQHEGVRYVRLREISEPARSAFERSIAHSTCPIVEGDPEPRGCAFAHDWRDFLDGLR